MAYTQKTKHAVSGAPLHAEAGYLRAVGAGRVEFVVVQPSGIVELHSGTVDSGTVDGGALVLQIDGVHTTPTAKSVTDVHRQIWVEQHAGVTTLAYQVSMAAVGEPLTHHLRATLVQQPSG